MPGYNKDLPYWARFPAFPGGEGRSQIAKISEGTWFILFLEYKLGTQGLWAAGIGQGILAMDMFPNPVPAFAPIFVFVFLLPVFAIWLPVFCNQPLLPFQTYVRWCFYMSCCSVGSTLVFEFFHLLALLPIHSETGFVVGRIMMHLGWLSFIPQIHYRMLYRKYHPSP
jgi:hypothetical protein